jgi:hypothetical protein
MLSVGDTRELQAAVLALKSADRELRGNINRATVEVGNAIWRPTVEAHATRHMDARVLAVGARVKGGNPPVAMAANSTRPVGKTKRLIPATMWQGFEFGADRESYSRYQRVNRTTGGTHTVERRTMRGLPPRYRKGRVVFPAFADVAPRMVSLWVQLIIKAYNDAAEGKR